LLNILSVPRSDAAPTFNVAYAGVEVGDRIEPTGETRDVSVRLHPEDRVDASNIEHLPIAVTGTNMMVPLDQIASITMGKGPAQIQHLDGKRMVAVSANTQGRASGEVTADAMKITKQIDFPTGYGITLGGEERDPAARLRAQGRGAGRAARGSAHARGARAAAADPDDHLRAHRRHDAGGDRRGRRRRVLSSDGGRDHRRHDHLDDADAARR